MKLPLSLAFTAAVAISATQASAQKRVAIRVGTIATARECTLYEGFRATNRTSVAAASGGYANAYGAGGYSAMAASSRSTFETFFVRDCKTRFAGIRSAIQAALASSGVVAVGPGGYVLNGRVEDVAPVSSGQVSQSLTGQTYGNTSEGLLVTVSITVADGAGRIVFGAPLVVQIETGSAGYARDTMGASSMTGDGPYGVLQRQVALIAARKVAFHFRPLTVVQGGGKTVQFNHGSPLIDVGTQITVFSPDGSSAARYRVTSAGEGMALAQQVGDADSSRIGPGSRGTVIEATDAAAGQSTMEKVDLP